MNVSRSFSRLCGIFGLSALLIPALTCAQQGPGGLGGYTGNIESNINSTSIAVQVRGGDGAKLTTMAIVNISNILGRVVQSQTTFGAQTVFQVGAGAYVVEVEAFGYEKVRVNAEVSSGNPHRIVTVTLKPDTENGMNYVPAANVALSPKAQKEVAKGVESFQANRFDEAVRHLDSAHQLAPTRPDIL
jgi:hypothetical protein